MFKKTITESCRGLKYVKGKLKSIVGPGSYLTLGVCTYEVLPVSGDILSACGGLTLNMLMRATGSEAVTPVEVADRTLVLHFVDGNFREVLTAGNHAFFNDAGKHEFKTVDISTPEVSPDIPEYIFDSIGSYYYTEINVGEYQKALLFYNNKLHSLLDAGRYRFWKTDTDVSFNIVDTRLRQREIPGQEILSRDKVTLRINFVCSYRITDFIRIYTEIDNFEAQLYTAAQLALREYVGTHTIDEILENKNELGSFVLRELTEKAKGLYLEITDASVKDIILPGEIRDIMNSVLAAEKQAQANVITRREEVASTRSLLNTAKLMEENATLYKLKELEYVEKICRNVGNINVTGGDLLGQLTEILRGKDK